MNTIDQENREYVEIFAQHCKDAMELHEKVGTLQPQNTKFQFEML